MVLVEELDDDIVVPPVPRQEAVPKKKTELKKGFLESSNETLYGPKGSPEGVVHPDTHKAHAEHKLNQEMNDGMNRGSKDNNGWERPAWYTKEWPKDCQYNSPGCNLAEMAASAHDSEIHRGIVRDGRRWSEALEPGVKEMRLNFSSITDEDVADLVRHLKDNQDVVELDLAHNKIQDTGIQTLVASLCGGAAPKLRVLRVYCNDFSELGQTMLTQGLRVLRKKIEVVWEEPEWAKAAKAARAESLARQAQESREVTESREEAASSRAAPLAQDADELD